MAKKKDKKKPGKKDNYWDSLRKKGKPEPKGTMVGNNWGEGDEDKK